MVRDDKVVRDVLARLQGGSISAQSSALESIRDLGQSADFRAAFGEAGAVPPLLRLLGPGGDAELGAKAAQALRCLADESSVRSQLIEAGGVAALLEPLRGDAAGAQAPALLTGALQALAALAGEEAVQLEVVRSEGLQALTRILAQADDAELLEAACALLQRAGASQLLQNAAREHGALQQLLRLLAARGRRQPGLAEVGVRALTVLALDNELNQAHVREEKGLEAVVALLDFRTSASLACAAATCLTVLCIGNAENKDALRELWAIPLLVSLLEQEQAGLQEQAVDCLRVLTTGSDLNKLALFSIPAGVRSLVRIMAAHGPQESITERAAAVVGNLSTTEQFFSSIRECGGLQRLVQLLDSGPASRVTEVAAKTLANMAGAEANRKGIRLAGGAAPLVSLLTQRPSEQVLLAAEEALRRLQVSNEERNAILETLRYCDQRQQQQQQQQQAGSCGSGAAANGPQGEQAQQAQPFTQFSVRATCELLRSLGVQGTERFEAEGVTGADLLELTAEEMQQLLCLSPLQAKKLQTLKKAFETFEAISATPGKAEISQFELRAWLGRRGRSEEEQQAVVAGFKRALGRRELGFLGFRDFALHFQWLTKTLQVMALADEEALESRSSLRSSLG